MSKSTKITGTSISAGWKGSGEFFLNNMYQMAEDVLRHECADEGLIIVSDVHVSHQFFEEYIWEDGENVSPHWPCSPDRADIVTVFAVATTVGPNE